MPRHSKRYNTAADSLEDEKLYGLGDGIELLKGWPAAKFDESVDIALNLGDLSGSQTAPNDEEGREVVRQLATSRHHRRERRVEHPDAVPA